jgi:LysM domain/Transglycosylase-like domain
MSRRPGQHAKTTSGYDARHAKPGGPGPAALIGTAAKAGTASLVAGAAGSALALSGTATASAATAHTAIPAGLVNARLVNANLVSAGPANSDATDLAAVKAARPRVVVHRTQRHHSAGHPAAARSTYVVRSGDSLSQISARFCGTATDFPSLAAASGIANPNLIFPGQSITLNCHAPVPAHVTSAYHHARHAGHHGDRDHTRPGGRHRAPGRHVRSHGGQPGHVGTGGMSAFEACVISRESGGNPRAVNPSSGAGGLFQFLPSTWAGLGYAAAYPGGAQTAPVSVQEAAFAKLYAEAGTSPWAPYDGC